MAQQRWQHVLWTLLTVCLLGLTSAEPVRAQLQIEAPLPAGNAQVPIQIPSTPTVDQSTANNTVPKDSAGVAQAPAVPPANPATGQAATGQPALVGAVPPVGQSPAPATPPTTAPATAPTTATASIDPNHAESRKYLGHVLVGSEWIDANELKAKRQAARDEVEALERAAVKLRPILKDRSLSASACTRARFSLCAATANFSFAAEVINVNATTQKVAATAVTTAAAVCEGCRRNQRRVRVARSSVHTETDSSAR